MPSIIKVDQIQSDLGTVNVSSNLQFSSGFTMRSPTFTGQATIPTINLTGGQIRFPSTKVPSSDPNTLDDYEEGTWTPSFRAESSFSSITYNTRIGRYVKIGKLVVATCRVGIEDKTGGSSSIAVSGFPFTFWDAENFQAGAVEHYNFGSWPSNIFSIGALSIGGTDYMNLLWNGSGTRTNVQVSSLVGGSGLTITVAYQIA